MAPRPTTRRRSTRSATCWWVGLGVVGADGGGWLVGRPARGSPRPRRAPCFHPVGSFSHPSPPRPNLFQVSAGCVPDEAAARETCRRLAVLCGADASLQICGGGATASVSARLHGQSVDASLMDGHVRLRAPALEGACVCRACANAAVANACVLPNACARRQARAPSQQAYQACLAFCMCKRNMPARRASNQMQRPSKFQMNSMPTST